MQISFFYLRGIKHVPKVPPTTCKYLKYLSFGHQQWNVIILERKPPKEWLSFTILFLLEVDESQKSSFTKTHSRDALHQNMASSRYLSPSPWVGFEICNWTDFTVVQKSSQSWETFS